MAETSDEKQDELDLRLLKLKEEIINLQAASENLNILTRKARLETWWQPLLAIPSAIAAATALTKYIFTTFQ